MFFVLISALLGLTQAGIISHDDGHGHEATSYQNIHMEHYHSVPVYIKHEDQHHLEHPIPKGHSTSKLEVHHGHGKHDHGFAIASVANDVHGHHNEGHEEIVGGGHESGGHEFAGGHEDFGGHGLEGGHEAAIQSHGEEYSPYLGPIEGHGHESVDLGHFHHVAPVPVAEGIAHHGHDLD